MAFWRMVEEGKDHSEFMVLALQLTMCIGNPFWGGQEKISGRKMHRTCGHGSHAHVLLCVAGFRPGKL
jgi:hypothetical protein